MRKSVVKSNSLPKQNLSSPAKPELTQSAEGKKIVIHGEKRHFSGPIPSPEVLQKYEMIQAGFADRIITMAENERKDRTDIAKDALEKNAMLSARGQILAFALCSIVILVSVGFAWLGHPWPGSFLGTSGFAGIITAFIFSHRGDNKNG